MAALDALGHAILWFAIFIADLALIAYHGPDALHELIEGTVARAKDAMQWVGSHPKAFIIDLIAAAVFAGYWLREFSSTSPDLFWLNIALSIGIFVSALIWWPLVIGPLLLYPAFTGGFVLAVLCSGLTLHFLTVPYWIGFILFLVLLAGVLVPFAPILLGLFVIMAPIIWGALLAMGLAFRFIVQWLGLHGIAKLLESGALVALGLAEYFKFYGFKNFNLTEEDYGQLVYFGAFAGAFSVDFTVLSLLSEKTGAWLGDRKL
jgi:hypothetical protein